MRRYQAGAASRDIYILAEGPLWDAAGQRVLWVDINAGKVHAGRLVGDQVVADQEISFPGTVGAVVSSLDGELLVAGSKELHTVRNDGTVRAGHQLLPAGKPSRLNDGACDPAGRFLVGSMVLAGDQHHDESLFRIEQSGSVTVIDNDLTLSNGLAWSPDGRTFYSIDTVPGVVWVRTYDPQTGRCGPREMFLHMTDGSPDGMCVDSTGNLWIAVWGKGAVHCYSPAGQPLAAIEVAAPNTSSVAFIGRDLDVLLITTASEQLTPAQLEQFPDSGRLFTCRVEATGLPLAPWSGS